MHCPRCGGRAFESDEPGYVNCLHCGDVCILAPLPYIRTLSYKDSGLSPKEPPRASRALVEVG